MPTQTPFPPPSVELTVLAVMIRAHMATLPRGKRGKYLRTVMATFDEFETSSKVVRLRGRSHDEAVAETRRQGAAWMRGLMAAYFMQDSLTPPR